MTRLPRPVGNDNGREARRKIIAAVAVAVALAATAHTQDAHDATSFGKSAGGRTRHPAG